MSEKQPDRSEEPAEREVNPAESPGPRGNPEVDPERVERDHEDLDRAGAN
jgi:hypothetical protein